MTASYRVMPQMLVIGAQRCGTTSLFRALEQHPQAIRPTLNKGINYFDVNYQRGRRWYAGHFPLARSVRRKLGPGKRFVAFEASGYYIFHPMAAERIATDMPRVQLVAMLRDPVERAFSAWKHESARGFETEPFEQALLMEADRIRGESDRMTSDPTYQSFAYRHHAYAARGDYVALLKRYYDRFPPEQIHVLYSEDFFADPEAEFHRLAGFLGISDAPEVEFDRHNARGSGPMPDGARRILTDRFAGQVAALEALTGRRPPWE